MAINSNQYDVTVTPELTAAAETAVTALLKALEFTVEVPGEESKHLLKMGEKSEDFVWDAHDVALKHREIMPPGLDLGEFHRAAAVRDLLLSVEEQLLPLLRRVRDSRMLAGADLMGSAMRVYAMLKAHGHGEEYREARAKLRPRFERSEAAAKRKKPRQGAAANVPENGERAPGERQEGTR